MAEIENIRCPICTQPIPSSWQNGLPPALATSVQRGVLQVLLGQGAAAEVDDQEQWNALHCAAKVTKDIFATLNV